MAFNYNQVLPNDNYKFCPYGVARQCESSCALYDVERKMCAHMIIAQVMAKQLPAPQKVGIEQDVCSKRTPDWLGDALNSGDGSYKP